MYESHSVGTSSGIRSPGDGASFDGGPTYGRGSAFPGVGSRSPGDGASFNGDSTYGGRSAFPGVGSSQNLTEITQGGTPMQQRANSSATAGFSYADGGSGRDPSDKKGSSSTGPGLASSQRMVHKLSSNNADKVGSSQSLTEIGESSGTFQSEEKDGASCSPSTRLSSVGNVEPAKASGASLSAA